MEITLNTQWCPAANPGFADGRGANHGERAERSVYGGPPYTAKPPEADSFLSIFIQKGPTIKDLNEN